MFQENHQPVCKYIFPRQKTCGISYFITMFLQSLPGIGQIVISPLAEVMPLATWRVNHLFKDTIIHCSTMFFILFVGQIKANFRFWMVKIYKPLHFIVVCLPDIPASAFPNPASTPEPVHERPEEWQIAPRMASAIRGI